MKSSDRNQEKGKDRKGKEDMNLKSFLELFCVEFHLLFMMLELFHLIYHVRIV
jgi:hypothetical protein